MLVLRILLLLLLLHRTLAWLLLPKACIMCVALLHSTVVSLIEERAILARIRVSDARSRRGWLFFRGSRVYVLNF